MLSCFLTFVYSFPIRLYRRRNTDVDAIHDSYEIDSRYGNHHGWAEVWWAAVESTVKLTKKGKSVSYIASNDRARVREILDTWALPDEED